MCIKKQHFSLSGFDERWRAVTAGLSSSASPFLSIFCISVSTKTNDLWPDLVRAIPKSTEVIWDSKRNFFSFFACTAWLPSHPSPSVLSVSSHIARLFSLQLWLMRSSWRPMDHVLSVRLCTPVHHICSRWTKKWILITAHPATRHPVLLSISLKPKNTKLKDFINQRFQHRIKRETSGYSTFVTVSIRLPATKKKPSSFDLHVLCVPGTDLWKVGDDLIHLLLLLLGFALGALEICCCPFTFWTVVIFGY